MRLCLGLLVLLFSFSVSSDEYYIGYNAGEMGFNDFENFAGEVGVIFDNGMSLKLARMDVKATEEHLSSSFAQAVDGENVEGLLDGWEFFALKVFKSGFYFGPSIGYYEETYSHTELDESVSSSSLTIGAAWGYREKGLFKITPLYFDFSMPFRYTVDYFEETPLGESTANSNKIGSNIWLSVGFQF